VTRKKIACVGLGQIGVNWASLFLAHGHEVHATDINPAVLSQALSGIEEELAELARLGHDPGDWRARLHLSPDLAAAVRDADFIQENGPEAFEEKQALILRIDAMAPAAAIISSSTSGLGMSDLQAGCQHPGRCLVGHPFAPAHLIPLVEIVAGAQTRPETVAAAAAFYEALGKTVIVLRRDVPGFICNRIQALVLQEALSLVQNGVATVEEVDAAVVNGLGLRWAIYGPFALAAFSAGTRGLASALRSYHRYRDDILDTVERVKVDDALISRIEHQIANVEIFTQSGKALVRRNAALVDLLLQKAPR